MNRCRIFAIDWRQRFMGAFNSDPRPAHMNTELGFMIDSPTPAQVRHLAFEQDVARQTCQVYLDGNDNIHLLGWQDGSAHRYAAESDTTWPRRMFARFRLRVAN